MRRKGTPCACECDPCKGKNYVRAVNNVSPDANGDFEIKAGNGIGISQSGDNSITIVNQAIASSFVAGDNIEINPSGDNLEIRLTDNPVINGTLQVNGDIIQQGAAYETHAEKVYTTNDYIYMRDGAIAGLGAGDFSGFQVKLYDGVNDGRLVIDNSGTARVGDVGDEQPLLTRDESADLTDGDSLVWDATGFKAITQTIPSAIANALGGKQNNISITNDTLPEVTIPQGGSANIGTINITSGKYLIVARFFSSGYSSTGGYFCRINNQTVNTSPYISGLTPLTTTMLFVDSQYGGTIPFGIANYGAGSLPFGVNYTLIKFE